MLPQRAIDILLRELAVALAAELAPLIREELAGGNVDETRRQTIEEPQSTSPVYLTTAQVAAALYVSAKTVRRWIGSGTLPALTVGREYRVEAAALRAFRGTNESSSDVSGKSVDDLVRAAMRNVKTGS